MRASTLAKDNPQLFVLFEQPFFIYKGHISIALILLATVFIVKIKFGDIWAMATSLKEMSIFYEDVCEAQGQKG